MKKRGFGVGKWNGVGGKLLPNETAKTAIKREAKEEINVEITALELVARLDFRFPYRPEWGQRVYTYLATAWVGSPKETEEMRPRWFKTSQIPFTKMWPDDKIWLPKVLSGERLTGVFVFGQSENISSYKLKTNGRSKRKS